jgi:hypothetical protein
LCIFALQLHVTDDRVGKFLVVELSTVSAPGVEVIDHEGEVAKVLLEEVLEHNAPFRRRG